MKHIILVLLIMATSTAQAWELEEWRTEDTVRQAVISTLLVADWAQTRDIAAKCDEGLYYETNPFLGKCPSDAEVSRYMLTHLVTNYLVARVLPQKYRSAFQYVYIGYEGEAVYHNKVIGLKFKF